MVSNRNLDLLGAAFFLAIGIAIVVMGSRLEAGGGNFMVDRGFWPKWIGIFMIAASLIMALQAWLAKQEIVALAPKAETWLLLVGLLVFFGTLRWTGYVFGGLLWLMAIGAIAGDHSPGRVIGFSIAAIAIGYLVFWKLLLVPLPVGELDRLLGVDVLIYR